MITYKKILIFSLIFLSVFGIYKIGSQILISNQIPVMVLSQHLINSDRCQINVFSKQAINQKVDFVVQINQTNYQKTTDWNFVSRYEFNFLIQECQKNHNLIQATIKYQGISFWNYLFLKIKLIF